MMIAELAWTRKAPRQAKTNRSAIFIFLWSVVKSAFGPGQRRLSMSNSIRLRSSENATVASNWKAIHSL